MAYEAKDQIVRGQQLLVQALSIPLKIVGNATAASVALSSDLPSRLFLKTSSVDQITGALLANETATYTTSPADASGQFQILIRMNEPVAKICNASLFQLDGANAQYAYLGSSTGITTGTAGGQAIMLIGKSNVDFTGANTLNACLVVEYETSEPG